MHHHHGKKKILTQTTESVSKKYSASQPFQASFCPQAKDENQIVPKVYPTFTLLHPTLQRHASRLKELL